MINIHISSLGKDYVVQGFSNG